MAKDIKIEFYEFSLITRNKVQRQSSQVPPIETVPIGLAFDLLQSNLLSINTPYIYSNGDYSTTIEHISRTANKIEVVFGYYDGIAPHRTLKNRNTGSYNVQVRADEESVMHLCHCVLKLNPNDDILATIGIESVTGMPVSILKKTLDHYFKQLEAIAPDTENVFRVTNPDNANNPDGTPDIHRFILKAKFYPMAGQVLTEAILSGKLSMIRVNGKRRTGLDDPNRRLVYAQADVNFKVQPLGNNEPPQTYFRSILDAVSRNRFDLEDIKTFAIIDNDAGVPQSIRLDDSDALNSAFVLKKKFDATAGRAAYADNTQINQIFLDEIWRKF